MRIRSFLISTAVFLLIYLLQEAIVNQLHLIGGGVSIFLIFALLWGSLGTPEAGAISGFGAGIMMDLSSTSPGPMGQWTLILALAGFAIAYLGYGDENFRANPFSLISMVAIAVLSVRSIYLILSLALGYEIGRTVDIIGSLLFSALWSIPLVPIMMPFVARIYGSLFETRQRT